MYKKVIQKIPLWVYNVGQVGYPEVENQNHPVREVFFFLIMLKVHFDKILQLGYTLLRVVYYCSKFPHILRVQ